ncbi:amidohydrolase [Nesterenkonia sp. HG001]|uniref:amidohydrolase n=1 Tax=Nesterenkonia sp. HG001 TaxID=2983207 RepID=UPI002AC5B37A|nr:amidohydrolase [Nesterenkonia sp. HG001]MDZ5076689.1 amidohydrolase [Nesterenkonia sp. HG001]
MTRIAMREIRRRLHAHPEPGFLEFHTVGVITEQLDLLGVEYHTGTAAMDPTAIMDGPSPAEREEWGRRALERGIEPRRVETLTQEGTAIVAIIRGRRPGPVWGLRCDIDALPIAESREPDHLPWRQGFASRTPYMHACGHDGHTSIGLGVLSRLQDEDFAGELRIFFQPAEEGTRGAAPMLAAGVADDVERMLAFHLRADVPLGTVIGGVENYKATTKWRAIFTGAPAHASGAPEKGRNALLAAAHATLGIHGMPRFATTDTRVNVGTFHAAGAANIIPAEATITYEVRAEDNDAVNDMSQRADAAVEGAARMHDVQVETTLSGQAPTTTPDEEMLSLIETASAAVPAITAFSRRARLTCGSDDAHLFIRAVQRNGGIGTYLGIGAQNTEAPHHSAHFDFDEAALDVTADLLAATVREAVGPRG